MDNERGQVCLRVRPRTGCDVTATISKREFQGCQRGGGVTERKHFRVLPNKNFVLGNINFFLKKKA